MITYMYMSKWDFIYSDMTSSAQCCLSMTAWTAMWRHHDRLTSIHVTITRVLTYHCHCRNCKPGMDVLSHLDKGALPQVADNRESYLQSMLIQRYSKYRRHQIYSYTYDVWTAMNKPRDERLVHGQVAATTCGTPGKLRTNITKTKRFQWWNREKM